MRRLMYLRQLPSLNLQAGKIGKTADSILISIPRMREAVTPTGFDLRLRTSGAFFISGGDNMLCPKCQQTELHPYTEDAISFNRCWKCGHREYPKYEHVVMVTPKPKKSCIDCGEPRNYHGGRRCRRCYNKDYYERNPRRIEGC